MSIQPAWRPAAAAPAATPVTGLLANLQEMERTREAYWRRYPATSPTRLRWRAQAVRHAMHVTAGDTVLEIGAGSGVRHGPNPPTIGR